MEPLTLGLIFLTGFIASFVGGIAGGGTGLFTIPVLMFLGLPAHIAIATSKVGYLGYGTSTIYKFNKSKKILYKHILPLTIVGLVGSLIGISY